jgi:hypothetical protein
MTSNVGTMFDKYYLYNNIFDRGYQAPEVMGGKKYEMINDDIDITCVCIDMEVQQIFTHWESSSTN